MTESYNPLSKEIENYENDLEIKKKIMQLKIINNNYNKDHFLDFCSAKRTDGDNLNRWTISEFQGIVDEYIKYHEDEDYKIKEAQKSKIQNEEKDKKINTEISQIENYYYSKPKKETEINCKKLEKTILNDKNVIIEIKNPKAISLSYFQSSYIQYEVYTNITNWVVNRRYSDFEWLRINLRKFYPKSFCPPIPNKKLGSRRFENDFVEKRMKFLNKFINSICENEIFKASDILISFLSLQDRNQFEEKMKEINSYTPSQFVEDVKNFNSIIKLIEDNNNNEQYYKNISNYFKLQSQVLNRLNYNLKNYYYNTAAACINLEEVQKDFETLGILNKKVIMKEEITKTYDIFGLFFKNWKRILFNQNEILKCNVKDFFKYISMESNSFDELIQGRETIKNLFLNEHNRLIAKKEKLWENSDITKFEIIDEYNSLDNLLLLRDKNYAFSKMCTRETQMENNLHKQFNYTNWMTNKELAKLINTNCEKFIDNVKSFCEKIYPTLNDSLNVWSEIASFTNN